MYLIGILAAIITGLLLQPSLDLEQPLPLIMEMPAIIGQFKNIDPIRLRQVIRFIERAAGIIPLSAVLTLLMHFDIGLNFVDGPDMEQSFSSDYNDHGNLHAMGILIDNWQATETNVIISQRSSRAQ